MGFDPSDRMAALSRPNGASTAIGYDGADRVSTMTTSAANPVHSLAFGYDSRGFPASMADPYGTTTYSHDDRGRLLGADHPASSPVPDETYTYDGAYRRTSWAGDPLSEVIYNAGDQLVQDAQFLFEYDDEGRRTAIIDRGTAEVTAYQWEALGVAAHVPRGRCAHVLCGAGGPARPRGPMDGP